MPRPAVTGMFDSSIRIWRGTPSTDAIAAQSIAYTPIATVGAAINRSRSPLTPSDGGVAPSGIIRWYGEASIDIQHRDLCEVVSGPDAGKTWEVNEIPVRPRGHHVQVDCVEWNGVLPLEDVS